MKMPFGKYLDVELTDVPKQYLRWLRTQAWLGAWLVKAIDAALETVPSSNGSFEEQLKEWKEVKMTDTIVERVTVRSSGYIGQEIVDSNGRIIAWTTDSWIANVIATLLSKNEHLLITNEED